MRNTVNEAMNVLKLLYQNDRFIGRSDLQNQVISVLCCSSTLDFCYCVIDAIYNNVAMVLDMNIVPLGTL